MVRVAIGSVVGGIVQWLVGALFWGTPLSRLVLKGTDDAQGAALQAALAQTLTAHGTGTYAIPWPDTPQGTILHGRGPVALIHFNTSGFPLFEGSAMLGGLVLSIVTILLIGIGFHAIAARVPDFASRAKLVVLFAVATTLYLVWSQPVFTFFLPWPYFVYLGLSDVIGLIAGGLVLVRWFVPTR